MSTPPYGSYREGESMTSKRPVGVAGIVAALALVGSVRAEAQITFGGCRDAGGRAVRSELSYQLPDVAAASVDQNGPVIYYNPTVLGTLSEQTRLFFYGHECGHHNLAHTFTGSHPLTREQSADCWGIVTLWRAGLLGPSDLPIIQRDLSMSPGDWTHLPGPYRAINLAGCLGNANIDPTVPWRRNAMRPCTHPAHPAGDQSPCVHPVHAMGDAGPCAHACPTPYGVFPCHSAGDVYPCSHAAHVADVAPCQHPAHPGGH
jgi:hypothetical protein